METNGILSDIINMFKTDPVTVKVVEYRAGSGTKEFQKVVSVLRTGRTYVGCSISPATVDQLIHIQ